MPTAARLISAIFLAALAWVVTGWVLEAMLVDDPDRNFGPVREVAAGVSALVGWVFLGARVGNPYSQSVGIGLTGVAAAIFWTLAVISISEMLGLALDRRYDGPMEALMGACQIGIEYGAELISPMIGVALVAGGIFGGVLAEFTSRRWR